MAEFASISITDGAETPVVHVFSPKTLDSASGTALYENRAEGVASLRESMRLRLRETAAMRTVFATLAIPRIKTETVNGAEVRSIADFLQMKGEVRVPMTWDASVVSDLYPLMAAMMADAVVVAMAVDGEGIWG